jgi:hypothetical protein
MNSRRGWCVLAVALVGLAGGAPMSCSSGGGSADAVTKAMSALPNNIKDSVTRYMGNFGDLNRVLGGVTNSTSANNAMPQLNQILGSMQGDANTINNASPETRKNVKTAFGSQISELTKALEGQTKRLMGNSSLASSMGSILNNIPKLSL